MEATTDPWAARFCSALSISFDMPGPRRHITRPLVDRPMDPNKEPALANSPQAKKRARQAEKNRQHNASMRSTYRTYIKKVESAVSAGDQDSASAALLAAIPIIDRMVSKGILHKNQAARYKSRLNASVKALS